MTPMKTYIAFVLLMSTLLSSCSLIGFGIGTGIDRANGSTHDSVTIFTDIKKYQGQTCWIQYPDKWRSDVTFESYSEEPEDSYIKDYEHYVASHQSDSATAAIALGDTIVIGRPLQGTAIFAGYFPEGILLSDHKLYFKDFKTVFKPKHLSRETLQELFEENAVPIRARLNFRDQEGKAFNLTNRDFTNATILPQHGSGAVTGFCIGLAIDVAAVVLAINLPKIGGFYGSANK